MLSDDITSGIGKGIRMTGSVLGGAIRGTLLGGALAFAGGAIASLASEAIWAIPAGAGLVEGTGAALAAMATAPALGAALGAGLAIAATGAIIGAAVLGISSIIPGVKDLFSFGSRAVSAGTQKVMGADERSQEVNVDVSARAPARDYDNPAYRGDGYGAQMMQRGDAAPAANRNV